MKLSRICLGTVQLGMDYGINNPDGKPSFEESRKIILAALENGITTFDTAPAYGDSEKILGRCIGDSGEAKGDGVFISKLSAMDWGLPLGKISDRIRGSLDMTLNNLRISKLPIYLLHRFDDIGRQDGFVLKELMTLKERGLVEKIGVSIYTPDEAEECLRIDDIEAIQVPFNLIDKRLLEIDFFRRAKARNKFVLVRSVFLQGLFFRKGLPDQLKESRPYREKLEDLVREEGLSMAELALRYVLSFEEIDSILVGVEKLGQLLENIRISRKGPLPESIIKKINNLGTAPSHVIDPRQWKITA